MTKIEPSFGNLFFKRWLKINKNHSFCQVLFAFSGCYEVFLSQRNSKQQSFLFFKLSTIYEKIYGHAKIRRQNSQHLQVGAPLSILVIGKSLAADIEIHSHLELAVFFLFSYDLQTNQAFFFAHFFLHLAKNPPKLLKFLKTS